MAHGMYIKIVGDASSYERALRKAAGDTKKFNREVSSATRGALAGSGLFRSFGRSIAFASGGFVGFAGATHFLRESVDAAREAAVAQRSLAAQMKASGESFAANRQRIEEVSKSYARFGFQNDEVIQSLTVLERGTGNINQAIELQGLTADLARAKNIDLASAAQTVAKVFGGQETALRRAVPGLHRAAHGYDLIREAQRKLAGQAAANTTAAERFQATLHDTQEILGTALLPILNKYLDQLTRWMDQMQRSGRLAKDVNTLANAIGTLAGAVTLFANTAGKLEDATNQLRKIPLIGKAFMGLGEMIDRATSAYNNMINAWRRWRGMADAKPTVMYPPGTLVGPPSPLTTGAAAAGAAAAPGGVAAPPRYTRRQFNQWFDARIARILYRAQFESLRDQLAAQKRVSALLSERIRNTRDITRKLKLEDQLLQVQADIRGTRAAIIAKAADAAQARADRRREAAERAQAAAERRRARLVARQFGILGFGPGGEPRVPNLRQLRRQFAAMRSDLRNASPRLQREFGRIGKVLSEAIVPPDIRARVREMLNDIRDELRKGVDGGGTPRGFTYNRPGVGGTSLAFAAAGGVHIAGSVNVYNTHNIGDLEHQLTKRQAGRAHNRRGAR